jgi:hypothetical protein
MQTFARHARAVWLARNWSVDEMLDTWASCAAEELASDERVKPPWTMSDMAHLWAHTDAGCRPRSVSRRWNIAVGRLAHQVLAFADPLPELPQGCPAREVGNAPADDRRAPGTSQNVP